VPKPPILFVVLALSFVHCASVYAVRGQVTSCADDQPLSEANVGLETMKPQVAMFSDTTGSDGAFGFKVADVPKESPARLTVQKSGYQTVEKAYDRAPAGSETICLEPTRR
jgi:Carboxypeptidase regulatory-like domain